MLKEIHFKTDYTHTGGNAVGQTFLGLKELSYSFFEDFRENLVYAKIDQLRTCSSIPQTYFFLRIVKLSHY